MNSAAPTGSKRCSSSARSTLACVFKAHVADLVQEQRPAVGLFELAGLVLDAPGESCPCGGRTTRSRSVPPESPRSSPRRTARRRASWPRESRARSVPCRCRSRRRSARARWCAAISDSCWRSAFMGTLSPMICGSVAARFLQPARAPAPAAAAGRRCGSPPSPSRWSAAFRENRTRRAWSP